MPHVQQNLAKASKIAADFHTFHWNTASVVELAQVFHDLGEDLGDLEKQALSKLGGLFS